MKTTTILQTLAVATGILPGVSAWWYITNYENQSECDGDGHTYHIYEGLTSAAEGACYDLTGSVGSDLECETWKDGENTPCDGDMKTSGSIHVENADCKFYASPGCQGLRAEAGDETCQPGAFQSFRCVS